MILLSHIADSQEIVDVDCSVCETSVRIPCVPVVSDQADLRSLLAGTMNTRACPTCGTSLTAELPVEVNLPELGIGVLFYTPFSYLEHDFVREGIAESECLNLIFYSLGELARQVHARIRVVSFQTASLQTTLSR